MKFKKLYPSFANPKTWRDNIKENISKQEWRNLRLKILKRDDYTCRYCGFKAEKWQIVHHIDGNPNNNDEKNLETICPMCNLIHHVGQGCVVQKIVDLYKKSKYSQNEIIQITRKLRSEGKTDNEIIKFLGLKQKVPFEMDRNYLKKLFGFITSRKTNQEWTQNALNYGYDLEKSKKI
ncbi:MAG: HNH endonuclease [Candidatus Aenigmatarchaeota archaeon]